ncbi:cytochrome c-type biogenesis protein CcmE [Citrobacter koseri]|nr:cytochrome c-type biogenesis protein CcmE [Citrobacter koseri]
MRCVPISTCSIRQAKFSTVNAKRTNCLKWGQRLRVGGMVMPGSVKRDPDSLKVNFSIYDAEGVVDVTYEGILPDLFREGQGVVVQGELGEKNHVQAKEVLAKHDENYTPPEVEKAMQENHRRPESVYKDKAS